MAEQIPHIAKMSSEINIRTGANVLTVSGFDEINIRMFDDGENMLIIHNVGTQDGKEHIGIMYMRPDDRIHMTHRTVEVSFSEDYENNSTLQQELNNAIFDVMKQAHGEELALDIMREYANKE